jgi:hypothetical protein
MTLTSWHSIYKNLPDADVTICCNRGEISCHELFKWPSKLGVPFTYDSPKEKNIINCDTMAVRTWDGFDVSNAQSNEITTFVNYNQCANFVLSSWINKLEAPFLKIDSFMKQGMSVNEIKIFDLWRSLIPIYLAIG